MRILALADDLTGALEAGAKFAAAGFDAVVTILNQEIEAEALVIDTESRHLPEAMAAQRVAEACRGRQADLIYKKTDSTLRGNIAAELQAMVACCGGPVAYVGAYPEVGRTVRGGAVYVDGVPVAETEFGKDALNPVVDSRIGTLLGPLECSIFDGETTADVDRAVFGSLDRFRILAGPSSVAASLGRLLGRAHTPVWPRIRGCLVVNGSRTEIARGQVQEARKTGLFDARWRLAECDLPADVDPAAAAESLARAAVTQSAAEDALLVFGGDTTVAILRRLGATSISPIGEVVPGVAVSRSVNRVLITKSGGFGPPDLIFRLRMILDAD